MSVRAYFNRRQQKEHCDWASRFEALAAEAQDPMLHRFYRTGVVSPDTPLSQVPFMAIDFETTGLDPSKDEIISIGLVPFDLQRIYCRDAANWLVKPRRRLNESSVVIHGITHSDLSDAPDLRRIMEEVLETISGKILVVHYRRIERDFFDSAMRLRLGEGIQFPVVDTMAVEADIQQRVNGGFWNRLHGRRLQSIRLGRSRSRYGLPMYNPHHALTDAIATAELLQAQIAWYHSADTPIGDLWL